MALTQTQEQALLDMLQKWTGAQERRPVKPSNLAQSIPSPSTGWHVVGYAANGDRSLMRIPLPATGYSLSTNTLNIPANGQINWDSANHLVSSKQLKSLYETDIKAPHDALVSRVSATEGVANSAKSTVEGIIPHVNAHTGALKSTVKGYTEGLVMDYGGLPSVIGASTVTFNRRFKGSPIVIVNFWGDVGNPRFSLAQSNGETWGIRLSATYPGIWAVIGEPV